jgi:mRNA interferase MazF
MPEPSRGEVWLVALSPTRGHEQAGVRPGLILSVDPFNHGPARLIVVLPLTTVPKGIPFHVEINPPEAGVKARSFVKCEDIRSVAKERLSRPWGRVSRRTLEAVEDRIRILLGL